MAQPVFVSQKNNYLQGFMALMTILITGAVATAIAVSLLLFAVSQSKISLVVEQSAQANNLATACAEIALQRIRDENYLGSENLTLEKGECYYVITDLGGTNREIQSTSSVKGVNRKVKVIVNQISPQINISSWQELADF